MRQLHHRGTRLAMKMQKLYRRAVKPNEVVDSFAFELPRLRLVVGERDAAPEPPNVRKSLRLALLG